MKGTNPRLNYFWKCSNKTNVFFRHSHVKPKMDTLPFTDVPTAKRWPFIGTTLDLIAAGSAPKLHKFIDGRHQMLGPIFREPLGSIEAVFLSCPKLMRSVFLYEGQYPTHPLPEAWLMYNQEHDCQRGLLFMDGEEWFNNRRIMNQLLLSGSQDELRALTAQATSRTINMLKEQCEIANGQCEIVDLEHILYRWSIDVVLFIMLGDAYNTASPALNSVIENFARNVYKIFEDSAKLMNFPAKIAKFLHLDIWTDFEESVTNVMHLGDQVMEQSIAELKNGNGLFSIMLQRNMKPEVAKRIVLDLLIAAGDTTTFASIWAIYSLAINSKIQNEVREEISKDATMGRKYIKRIIRETLRLYPVAPFIGRFMAKDALIGCYEVPKGTLVLLSLFTSGRDENNFLHAKEFNPDRWKRNHGRDLCGVVNAHGSLPFSSGSRSCVGRRVAMLQMELLTEFLLSNFQLICLNKKPVDIALRLVAVPDAKIKLAIKLIK